MTVFLSLTLYARACVYSHSKIFDVVRQLFRSFSPNEDDDQRALSRDGREQHNRQRLIKAVRERFKTAKDVVVGFTRSATVSGRLGAMPDVFESLCANSNEGKVVCVSSGHPLFFFGGFRFFVFLIKIRRKVIHS